MEELSGKELGMPKGGLLDEGGPASEKSELEMHAGAFARAIKRGDSKGIADAFRLMKQACEAEGYPDDADADDLNSGY